MKLISVTVQNFRSITAARSIPISSLTTLVGPNNEGKSNILRALVLAMTLLVGRRDLSRRLPIRRPRRSYVVGQYDWTQDYPLKLQEKEPEGGSVITLEFELSDDEIAEFQKHIGSRLNDTLPISFVLNKETRSVTVPKQGRRQKALSSKAELIADFIAGKMGVQYIPAVRTAQFARGIVNDLVRGELAKVEQESKYKQALLDIAAAQQPVLQALSDDITTTMREFLPNIAYAKVVIEEGDRSYALREISELLVNDGVETPLESKGDGVQSLAALALMRHISRATGEGKEMVIALEEPESHLHPSAIRQLKNVLIELSARYQVVITTHNPIFTNRADIHQNIIVKQNRAYPAKNVKEVRDVLGVRLDDNLSSADTILIVEGEEDRIAIRSMLSSMDSSLAGNIQSGRLGIDVLGGAANLRHRIRLHSEAVCRVHVLLDDNSAGRTAFKAADRSKKWTDRLKNLLRRAGKPTDDGTIQIIKIKVAQAAASLGVSALHPSKSGPVESLRNALLGKLGQ